MTIEEFWAAIRNLGLTPTNRPEVFMTRDGRTQGVPSPADLSPTQRLAIYEMVREAVEG